VEFLRLTAKLSDEGTLLLRRGMVQDTAYLISQWPPTFKQTISYGNYIVLFTMHIS